MLTWECHGQCAYLIYIYIYIKGTKVLDQFGSSILVTPYVTVIVIKNCKSNHKALLAKEIFDDIKCWIIVLGASPCKRVFFNHQRYVYIPLSGRSTEVNFLAQFHPAGVRSYIYIHNPRVLNHLQVAYGKFTKRSEMVIKTVRSEDRLQQSQFQERRGKLWHFR